ncbi:hypothetical protein, partial [Bifidobacterium bifidum]|uniref:hypothetical protein n=1 Tax=Bifidobacterium bifidum TaxID=1681 RepID=UPI001A7E185F
PNFNLPVPRQSRLKPKAAIARIRAHPPHLAKRETAHENPGGGREKEGEKDEEGKREEEIMKKHLSDVESDL